MNDAEPKGLLFIISAPSGAGKTSLARGLIEAVPDTAFSISHTTRPKRPDETHGIDYYFVSEAQFKDMIGADGFLEHAKVFDNWYGTSRAEVQRLVNLGKTVLLDIDWQGAREVRNKLPDAKSIFIKPPSLQELEKRLRERAQDSEEVIRRRMRQAPEEMCHADEYDHVVINDNYDRALAELQKIVEG